MFLASPITFPNLGITVDPNPVAFTVFGKDIYWYGLIIAGLSFIGMGIKAPMPEWGAMLSNARTYIRDAWHITVMPGAAIMITILILNIIGDGLRDALDPRMKN